jgi:colanic acid/amylovoran biosynthesis glycosyltransferase
VILLLFALSYPYDGQREQTFLEPELAVLRSHFERIILVPKKCQGRRLPLPASVEVDESLAASLGVGRKMLGALGAFSSSCFYRDLFSRPALLGKPSGLARLLAHLSEAGLTRRWAADWFRRAGHLPRDCMFYTYWFESVALGIGLLKKSHPQIRIVSRAHGYDIYEERYPFPYLPCRPQMLELVDGVYPDSLAGAGYLQERYPAYRAKIETAFLGIPDPGFVTSPSQDGIFRIVSCAVIRPLKRVDLLLEGIAEAARRRPSQKFEWHHFGNGEAAGVRESMQARAEACFPSNARAWFPGYSSQADLFVFYRDNPVDVFVNTSTSEGTPVSIMEAISCGIPVMATAVGGNREIVSDRNGILLPPHPRPEEIADGLFALLDDPAASASRRLNSRSVWQERYNAETNFNLFGEKLKEIRGR